MTVSSATIVCSCAAAQRAVIVTTTVLSSRCWLWEYDRTSYSSVVRMSICDESVRCTGQRLAMANSRARCSVSSAPSSAISRSMTVSRVSRASHAAQSSTCTREWRRRTVTRWSGHCFRRAYIAMVIDVQDPSEARSRSYGVGPVSVPPARDGSSLRKRCEPATMSWAKPSPVPRTITTPSAGRSPFMTITFLPVRAP